MSANLKNREYVVQALNALGSVCPEKYTAMLEQTPENRCIANLRPWAFDQDPATAEQFCSEAAGRPVLPFALAIEQDMMACFLTESSAKPTVIVINPWSEDKTTVVQAQLPDYDAWLKYAAEVSRQVHAREAEEDEDN
jgi:hypothetical protein